ncbi:hypothetical protein ONE63_005039 [Megalurothrips usitatus]|uniref:Uncharacterized protein n=1 Tax=Megalurothrips usitatus TaxID=439358 RepID=A0AAV7X838_9NEOP|nr:hypothetical protein ONE63_005039 [Megalurothrips usitatus]
MRKLARNVRQARWRDWSFWGLALICHMSITRTYGVKRIPSYAGPFVAFVERLDNCPPPPVAASNISVRLTHFKPSRPMDKQYAWGSFTWPLDMDDESYLNMHLDKWANNQWKQNFFVFNFKNKACTVMRDYMPAAKFIFDVAKSAGATSEKGKCIMPETVKVKAFPFCFGRVFDTDAQKTTKVLLICD